MTRDSPDYPEGRLDVGVKKLGRVAVRSCENDKMSVAPNTEVSHRSMQQLLGKRTDQLPLHQSTRELTEHLPSPKKRESQKTISVA